MREHYVTCCTNNPNSHNASNALSTTVQNPDYKYDNSDSDNKDNRNKIMRNSNKNSGTNSNNFLSSDNSTLK